MKKIDRVFRLVLIAGLLTIAHAAYSEPDGAGGWLPSLQTETPQEGFALAVKLARTGVKTTQPDVKVLKDGRREYAREPDALMKASEVIAIHFQTVAAANNYWRKK